MRFFRNAHWAACLLVFSVVSQVNAIRYIMSNGLAACMENSLITADDFSFRFFPDNRTLYFTTDITTEIKGDKPTLEISLTAYGKQIQKVNVDPCANPILSSLCHLNVGKIRFVDESFKVPAEILESIPGVAFEIPDLDGVVTLRVYNKTTNVQLACVQTSLRNSRTVHQVAVSWCTALISSCAFIVGAIASARGNANTASHVAVHALALFGFFQAQAMFGMMSAPSPPIVRAWTQNFQWSMGLISIKFMQKIFSWYINATSGSPTLTLEPNNKSPIVLAKRGLDVAAHTATKLFRRADSTGAVNSANVIYNQDVTVLTGIKRAGFEAGIEASNIFMTGYAWFIVLLFAVALLILIFRFSIHFSNKQRKVKSTRFSDFEDHWKSVLKGVLYRFVAIGFLQIMLMCFWEFAKKDSPAAIVLAVLMMISVIGLMGWATYNVFIVARKSVKKYNNPAYLLFSDSGTIFRWGWLYVQYSATHYWFIICFWLHAFVKAIIVGTAQGNQFGQAIANFCLETVYFIALCAIRPYMDKKTNTFMISIGAVTFFSSLFYLFFTRRTHAPSLVAGVLGVLFFVLNAIVALVLLIMIIVSALIALLSRNPDVRYKRMKDDRTTFFRMKYDDIFNKKELEEVNNDGRTRNSDPTTNDEEDDPIFGPNGRIRERERGLDNASRHGVLDEDSDTYASNRLRTPSDLSYQPLGRLTPTIDRPWLPSPARTASPDRGSQASYPRINLMNIPRERTNSRSGFREGARRDSMGSFQSEDIWHSGAAFKH